ncbi:tRNA (guanine-N(7)-)-methyltransferase [Sanguibacter keddieii DSM 10542]|uniref:tRNA (guanine-N(7)-)-methyltransferase n=1 Tax=Sanguibacter keddieii (strain ATCC 51767 / DSM 10542 / NCFB 3025 / ST-74) TaxID=446469 RepID=D1BJZ2_SANKS|nr:tRNA (guanosine(46)-N7)-methyltransferase TrmB [Sanguibacter keddieii]ACZ22401.1 tRNA (guanine-N(7)-)-methyltransferase [Sanguibacter keddieii DSM 10542]
MSTSPRPADAPVESTPDDDLPGGRYRARTVSFVQRSGRLKDRQQRTWDALAPQFVVEPPRSGGRTSVDPGYVLDAAEVFGRSARLVVEVGSGQGEAVAHAAAESPETDFLAVEVYTPGVAQTLQRLRTSGSTNVRLMQADAAMVLGTTIAPASVDELWLFFPDPWHKSRHTKRRLVTPAFASLVARVLRPGGTWRLATDWADYARQMREVLAASEEFDVDLDAPRFAGRPVTSFERKGTEKGRDIADLTAVRRA